MGKPQPFFFFLISLFIYLFIYGCIWSLLLCVGLLQLQRAGALFIAVQGLSLRWLPLLLQSTGSRCVGLSSCGTQAQLLHGMWDPPDWSSNPCTMHWPEDS